MSKITRARNQKRPGTSGGGRNQEGEAVNRDSFRRNPPWAVFQRGSAHEPSPLAREWHGERLRRSQVVEILGSQWVPTRSPTPLNRLFLLAGGAG